MRAFQEFREFRADLTEIGLEPSGHLVELDQQIARGEVPRSGVEEIDSIEGGQSSFENLTYGPFVSPDGRFVLTTHEAQRRLWDREDRTYVGAFPSDEGNIAEGATGEDALRLATIVG